MKLMAESLRVRKVLRRFNSRKSLFDIEALGACFSLGLMTRAGEDEDGDPIWRLTESGRLALSKEKT